MSEATAADLTPPAAAADTPAPSGSGPAPAAEGAEGGTATSPEAGQSPSEEEGQGAGNGNAPEGGASAEGDEPKEGEGGAAPGAPEQYADFTLPEGYELPSEMLDGVTSFAKAHNLTQEQAQGLVDLGVKQADMIAARFVQEVQTKPVALADHWASEWSKQTQTDPELGGDKLKTTMAMATRVFATFATPELQQFLAETGMAHHPELIRFMTKVGAAISEDTLVTPQGGNSRGSSAQAEVAKTLYPDMK